MKHYGSKSTYDDKHRTKQWKREHSGGGFRCAHCRQFVVINERMGTVHRNHCNLCLWSKHVDEAKGDRLATCGEGMRPIGLTFKHAGFGKIGEIMIVHLCLGCGKISINRIARDDSETLIVDVLQASFELEITARLVVETSDIHLLGKQDTPELDRQLYGHA